MNTKVNSMRLCDIASYHMNKFPQGNIRNSLVFSS